MTLRRAILGVLLVLSVCPAFADDAAPAPWLQDCKLNQVASLPMTIAGGHIIIPIGVNGTERPFILDTGGYGSSLSAKVVADLKLDTYAVDNVIIRDVGGRTAGRYVRSETLGFGRMLGKGLPLLVLDRLGSADGLLAPDLLRNFDVELDFAGGKVNLFHHHRCNGRAVYWTTAYATLPFDITEDTHIRVPVTLDGKSTMAVIDTGAPASAMSLGSADTLFSLSLTSPDMEKLGTMNGPNGGSLETYSYPFKTLTLGAVTVANPVVRVADGRNFVGGDYAKLLLGLSIMRHLHVYIAYQEGEIYVSDATAQ